MKTGDKLKCIKTILNVFDCPLFIEGNIYEILNIKNNIVSLDHVLYGCEYGDFEIDILNNFINITELRKMKLKRILK